MLATNERILADRERLAGLVRWLERGHQITAADRDWLAMLAARYEAPAGDLAELARRVDVVPPSMALAQAAVKSGWGTSRVAREHNAPFGQIALDPAADGEGGSADDVRYAAFETLAEAVDAYVRNLNTHAAYEDFRLSRADARAAGHPLDGSALMGHLVGYSELGEAYVDFIREVIGGQRPRPPRRRRPRPRPRDPDPADAASERPARETPHSPCAASPAPGPAGLLCRQRRQEPGRRVGVGDQREGGGAGELEVPPFEG